MTGSWLHVAAANLTTAPSSENKSISLRVQLPKYRAPKDHIDINIRILQTMVSGIPLMSGM